MTCEEILSLIAIIIAPIAAVLIGQWLQNKAEKRKDKLDIFKSLMISRTGWSPKSVRALNIIDIVFLFILIYFCVFAFIFKSA